MNTYKEVSRRSFCENEKMFPRETSTNYSIAYDDIHKHMLMLSGKEDYSLECKLNDFKAGEILDNKFINYDKFLKNETDFSDFFVEKMYHLGYLGDSSENRYIDNPYVYLVGRGKEYGAVMSIEPRPNAFLISQIQGFKGGEDVWHNLRYQDFLMDIVYEDFKDSGISELWVSPYFRNDYSQVRDNKNNTKIRQYDRPAKRQGFEFNLKKGLWVKEF